jgi:Bacterial Ig domain
MPAEACRRAAPAVAALLVAGALGPGALAQESSGEVCRVLLSRGATAQGGASGTMTVRNLGRACRIENFTVPESKTPTSRLEVVSAPKHGRLEIIQPNTVAYTPPEGFRGADEFAYEGSGPGRQGGTLPFSVRVSVRVVGPHEPLR